MIRSSELAIKLGVTKNTVINLANAGQIPCIKLPNGKGEYRFNLEEVLEALRHDSDSVQK